MGNYTIERDGQIEFFDNYGIPYEDDASVLVDNTDGVYNGNILEFKLSINNLNRVLFQAIKYLSRMRVKGENVPANILLIDLNAKKAYEYKSETYRKDIHKIYVGASSKDNSGFIGGNPENVYDYSDMVQSNNLKKVLKGKKTITDMYMPIDIDENCIVGWAERYYNELPKASKGDFLGDDTGTSVKVTGEIRNPRHFTGLINPYKGKSNEKFKYLMDCLNDRLSKKDLGAFYTPIPYAKKAAELVEKAVQNALDAGKKDYIILDRCAGTGNLESALVGICDVNGDDLISHCVVSTYEYYEYKVLNERIGDLVRDIIPPTEADVVYENGKVSNADAMSEDFINNPIIKAYLDDDDCAIILFENPPYQDSSAITFIVDNDIGRRAKTGRKNSYVLQEFKKGLAGSSYKGQEAVAREISNLFIWSGFKYYLRQPTDSYIIYSPVKYFKHIGIIEKQFVQGYAFNRKYFHASDSVISCILWNNEDSSDTEWKLPCYDINDGEISYCKDINIKKVYNNISYLAEKRDVPACDGAAVVGSNGYEKKDWTYSKGRKPVWDDSIVAYMVSKSFMIDPKHYNLVRTNFDTALKNSYGINIFKDNYLKMLPLFVAKLFPRDAWYEKDVYNTTSDGGDAFMKDKEFLKRCLIYTCLSNQNKCITFDGSDGRHYQNELCFDDGTLASVDLAKNTFDSTEKDLLDIWVTILSEAKATGKCKPGWTYGVYQITKEINTYHTVGTGKNKKNVYDFPSLNGNLDTLRTMLKAYYKSHITDKMFEYELLK